MSPAPLFIFGAGGMAREVLQLVHDINGVRPTWDLRGFVVDAGYAAAPRLKSLPVLTGLDEVKACPSAHVVVAVGASAARAAVVERVLRACRPAFPVLVHPGAWVGRDVELGEGTVVCAGSVLTTDISVGRHVHINVGSRIGHDARLHSFVSLNYNVCLAGQVTLEEGVEIGTAAALIPRVSVGAWSVVGAGAVVTRSLPSNVTAVGVPARVIRPRLEQDAQ